MPDYRDIDNPDLLKYIFYPRSTHRNPPANAFDRTVSVDPNVAITCRFYRNGSRWPWIIFFHGNGEVVSDYDYIAPFYAENRLNLVVADYRGYGASSGSPTLANLVHDAPIIFENIASELSQFHHQSNVWLMGRSLGSISALEIAYRRPDRIRGLIIESGFPSIIQLIVHLGLLPGTIDLHELYGACIDTVRSITTPALIIHGEYDTLVPLRGAEDLYRNLVSTDKELLIIPGADHNDIMFTDLKLYFGAIQNFVQRTDAGQAKGNSDEP